MMAATREGGCLCGAVRYVLDPAPDHLDVCHCAMCRTFGGGIGLGLEVAPGGWKITGEDNVQTYQSSEWAERGFCKICGSSLFWRMTETEGPGAGMVSLCAGTLDDLNGLPLKTEIYVDEKPDAYAFAGDTKKMTGAEVEAMFAPTAEGDSQ